MIQFREETHESVSPFVRDGNIIGCMGARIAKVERKDGGKD